MTSNSCPDIFPTPLACARIRLLGPLGALALGLVLITYPENSVAGVPAGNYSPQVTDGYWLLLEPLAKGTHEIHVRASASHTSNGPIAFDVIHHITVQ